MAFILVSVCVNIRFYLSTLKTIQGMAFLFLWDGIKPCQKWTANRKPASHALVHMPRMQSLVCKFVKKCKEFDWGWSSAHQGEVKGGFAWEMQTPTCEPVCFCPRNTNKICITVTFDLCVLPVAPLKWTATRQPCGTSTLTPPCPRITSSCLTCSATPPSLACWPLSPATSTHSPTLWCSSWWLLKSWPPWPLQCL